MKVTEKKQKEKEECPECDGEGKLDCDCCEGIGTHMLPQESCREEYACDECFGCGDIKCIECEGTGKIVLEEKK